MQWNCILKNLEDYIYVFEITPNFLRKNCQGKIFNFFQKPSMLHKYLDGSREQLFK